MNSINSPQGWAHATISGLIGKNGIFIDGDWVESKDQDPDGDVRLIQLADVGDGLFRDKSSRFLTSAKAAELNCTFLMENDVLIARMPDPLGRSCTFPKINQRCVTVVDVCVVRTGTDYIDHDWLMYAVNSPQFRLKINALQSGSTRKRISRGNLATLELPIPPSEEQHRIVTKIEELLTQLDAGVASLKKAQAQLKRYRQAVLKDAFEGRLTQEWREELKGDIEPADVLFKKIKIDHPGDEKEIGKRLPLEISEMFKIPDDWIWVQAQDVCENISNGYTPTAEKLFQDSGEIPFIKVYNLTKTGAFDFTIKPTFISRQTHETELKRSAVYPNDVLMSIVGPPMGKLSLIPDLFPEWNINQAIVIYRTFPEYSRKLILYVLLSDTIQKWLQKRGKTTAGQTNYTITMSRSLPIPLPPIEEQPKIVEEIERHFSQIDHLENTITISLIQSESLRQSILKQAFEGKLVPQDPADEPASILLERIKAEKLKGKALQPKSPKRKIKNGN